MEKIQHICFITPGYPTQNDPVYTFVRELICSIADLGIKCSVIAPQSITNITVKRNRKRPFLWKDISEGNNEIDIYQPYHVPFLNFKLFGSNLSGVISKWTVIRTFKRMKINSDILYAHFWHSGVIAGDIGNTYNIPVFVASGESKIWVNDLYNKNEIKRSLAGVKGVICVSTKNLEESIELNLTSKDKIRVIPNAINNKIFYKKEKLDVRKKLGFRNEDFIIAFTGAFNHRKGVLRLAEAIDKIDGVKGIFIGSGDLKPKSKNILFSGRLPHNQIVDYLNAADVFVLPTLAEGCSNAIVEAMACGLPVISSDLSFNDDILCENNSIRVDSNNIDQIANAIKYLKENPIICEEMARASLELARNLEIENRANRILDFIRLVD